MHNKKKKLLENRISTNCMFININNPMNPVSYTP